MWPQADLWIQKNIQSNRTNTWEESDPCSLRMYSIRTSNATVSIRLEATLSGVSALHAVLDKWQDPRLSRSTCGDAEMRTRSCSGRVIKNQKVADDLWLLSVERRRLQNKVSLLLYVWVLKLSSYGLFYPHMTGYPMGLVIKPSQCLGQQTHEIGSQIF